MLTAEVENMLITSISRTLETGVVLTLYTVIISTVRRQSIIITVGSTLVRLLISAWVFQ